jgi:hypothetical protein
MLGTVDSPKSFASLYQQDPTQFYLLARGISVFCSVVSIAFLYKIVNRLRNKQTALFACLFLSLCFLDVRHSHFAEPYSILTLLVLFCIYSALNYFITERLQSLILSAVTCGICIGIRYSVFSLGLVPLIAVGYSYRKHDKHKKINSLFQNLGWIVLSIIIGILIGDPGLLVNLKNVLNAVSQPAAFATTTHGFSGIQFTSLPTWEFYGDILLIAWGLPLIISMIIGIVHTIQIHQQVDLLFAIFSLSYGAVLISVSAASSAFSRYLIPILPFLAFLAADGTITIMDWIVKKNPKIIKQTALISIASALVIIPTWHIIQLNRLWSQVDTRTQAATWIESNIPEGNHIATQWYGPPLATFSDPEPDSKRFYDVFVLDPFSFDPNLYNINYYKSNGFNYLIISSFIYNLQRVDPSENESIKSFYKYLEQNVELVAEFKPYEGDSEPPFFFEQMWGPITNMSNFERPGPVIKIYQVTTN